MPDGLVPIVNPRGELVDIQQADIARALSQGYKAPTPEQLHADEVQQGAQGPLQGLAAFGEGAGSALTFGALPGIETALGITTPERIEARKQERPILHALGTGLGIAGPIIATGGAAAPAELAGEGIGAAARGAAEWTAPALIARAGRAAFGATEGALPGLAGRVLPTVAAGATEGALYSGSDVTEKALLGDPQLTWEKAASELGLGALFGGTLAGAGKGLSDLLPGNLGESIADKLGETAGNRNLKAAAGPGGSKGIIRRLQKQLGKENLTEIGREMGESGLVGPLSTPESTYGAAHSLKETAGKEMGAILDGADVAKEGALAIGDVIGRARSEILKPLTENPLEQGVARQIGEVLDGYEQKYADSVGFRDLHDIRRQVSDKIYGLRGVQDPMGTAFKDALHDFRSLVSDEINEGLDRSGLASDAWKAANRKYQVASVAQQLAEDGMLKHTGNNLLSLTEIMAGLTGASSHGLGVGGLAAMGTHFAREHASGILGWAATGAQRRLLMLMAKSDKKFSAAISGIFRSGEGATAGAAAERFSAGGMVTPERFADVAGALRDYGGNLDRLAGQVSGETAQLQDHAPGTADAAHAFAARVVQHLGSKLPDPGQRQLLDAPFEPSGSELAAYNRHHEVAEHGPIAVLEHLAHGTLHPDHLEASQALFPRLHAEVTQLVMERLAEAVANKEPIPRALRSGLGMLLGSDLDSSTTPAAILSAQQAYGSPPVPQPTAKAPGKARNVETHGSERLATGSQGTLMRMGRT